MDKVEFAIENFKNMQELIRLADQKAGAIVIVYGFIITATYESSKGLILIAPHASDAVGLLTFAAGFGLVLVILYQIQFILCCILKPKLASNYKRGDSCLYYFEHVAAQDKAEIMSCFVQLDEDAMLSDVASQIYEVSNTLTTKMKMVSQAINGLCWATALTVLYVILGKLI